jgi:hypothetical protein
VLLGFAFLLVSCSENGNVSKRHYSSFPYSINGKDLPDKKEELTGVKVAKSAGDVAAAKVTVAARNSLNTKHAVVSKENVGSNTLMQYGMHKVISNQVSPELEFGLNSEQKKYLKDKEFIIDQAKDFALVYEPRFFGGVLVTIEYTVIRLSDMNEINSMVLNSLNVEGVNKMDTVKINFRKVANKAQIELTDINDQLIDKRIIEL